MSSILVICEAQDFSPLAQQLQASGFTIELCNDAEQGVERALSEQYLLTVVSASFKPATGSRATGIEMLRRIRQRSLQPVMLLADHQNGASDAERVLAFELGADDYLQQPYLFEELIARIRAILRRSGAGVSAFGHLLKVNNLELDRLKRKVTQNGEEIVLTTSEFDLLELLVKRAGQAVPREEMARTIFGRGLNLNDRSIDVHISNLRKKLSGEMKGAARIKAIRGVGYTFRL